MADRVIEFPYLVMFRNENGHFVSVGGGSEFKTEKEPLFALCFANVAMSTLQWPWPPAHHRVGAASVDLRGT
jgi:hypothetical protein